MRGRRVKTTRAVVRGECPDDRVNREFQDSRANALWVSDPRFHHTGAGSTWPRGEGSPARPSSSTPMRGVYNHRRLFEPLGHVPPAAFEAHYHHTLRESAMAA